MARWIFLRICAFWDTKRFIFESVAELLHNNAQFLVQILKRMLQISQFRVILTFFKSKLHVAAIFDYANLNTGWNFSSFVSSFYASLQLKHKNAFNKQYQKYSSSPSNYWRKGLFKYHTFLVRGRCCEITEGSLGQYLWRDFILKNISLWDHWIESVTIPKTYQKLLLTPYFPFNIIQRVLSE